VGVFAGSVGSSGGGGGSGSAARTGWSREAVSGVAQKVVNELLDQALVPAR